jgi:hypothetical protein
VGSTGAPAFTNGVATVMGQTSSPPALVGSQELLPQPAPANTVLPAISGSAVEGQTLIASSGSWSGSPTSYAYQWQHCDALGMSCLDVGGATASSYKLSAGDVGGTMSVTVTASNASGSSAANSAPTAVVSPAESTSVLIGSTAVQPYGDSNSAGSAEAFRYTASGTGTVRSLALYVNSGNSATVVDVGLYSDVAGHAGTLLASATISSPTAGAWNAVGISPVAVSSGTVYWLAALGPTGKLALRDVASGGDPSQNSTSSSLTELRSSWSGGASWTDSPASFYASTEILESPPPAAPANTVLPVVSGSAAEGETLSASSGSWSGSPTSYAYQWQDCNATGGGCASIAGATASSYKLVAGDVGHTVRVVVTASNASGSTSASSAATAVVVTAPPPAAPANTVLPVVSGSAVEGETLSSSKGSWSGSPTSYAYQWQDCNATGGGCASIAGATASSYKLVAGDVGHTVRVVVTASNASGSTSASSAATAVVGPPEGGGPGSCTTTVSNLASVVSLSGSEPDGSTICIADGSYGSLALSAARTGYVTIAAANGPGHVTLSNLTVSSSASHLRIDGVRCACNTLLGEPGTGPNNIQIVRTESEGFQVEAGSADLLFDHDYSHNGPYGFLLNGSRHPVPGGCCETANYPFIENVTISNSKVGPVEAAGGADAFQVKGFKDLTISNNDIYDIYQNGNHNDGVQTVHGGSNLTITHNYFHDGNVELFMIKDGDVMGTNFITDNLVVRENSSLNPACGGCSTAVFGQYYSPQNATIANNTIVEPGLFLRSQLGLVGNGNPDYLVPSNINVNHNVINEFRAQDDDQGGALGSFAGAMTTSYNMFGPYTENYLTAGTGDTFVPTINNTSSIFVDPAGNDFRLASNPNNIGVDWKPSDYHYGP